MSLQDPISMKVVRWRRIYDKVEHLILLWFKDSKSTIILERNFPQISTPEALSRQSRQRESNIHHITGACYQLPVFISTQAHFYSLTAFSPPSLSPIFTALAYRQLSSLPLVRYGKRWVFIFIYLALSSFPHPLMKLTNSLQIGLNQLRPFTLLHYHNLSILHNVTIQRDYDYSSRFSHLVQHRIGFLASSLPTSDRCCTRWSLARRWCDQWPRTYHSWRQQ